MRRILFAAFFATLACEARADIIDSGTLTMGGQGIFSGTVTVQGNALGVSGSVSATSATLSGTGAGVYSLSTSSGIHLLNGKLKLDAGAMIQWADGTTSTTTASGAASAVNSSSATTFSNKTLTSTKFGVCQATLTITAHSLPLAVGFAGTEAGDNGNNSLGWAYLVNGSFGPGQNPTTGVTVRSGITSTIRYNMSATDVIAGYSGSTNICISFACGSGACTTTIAPDGGLLEGIGRFFVYEVGSN